MWRILLFVAAISLIPTLTLAWWASRVDTVENYYSDGKIKEQYQTLYWEGNDSNTKTGFYRSWHSNGKLDWDGNYQADLKVGTWVRWDSTGRRTDEVSYVAGMKHGAEIEWLPNGIFKKRLYYHYGVLQGLCTWNQDNATYDGQYNNPNLNTLKEFFCLDGKEIVPITEEVHEDINGYPCSSALNPYYNDDLDLWVEWKTTECKFYVGKQVDGKKQGLWTLWSSTGEIMRVDFYEKGNLLK